MARSESHSADAPVPALSFSSATSTELDAGARERFGVDPDDHIQAVIAADGTDPWLNFGFVLALAGGPLAASWLIAWAGGDPRAPTALVVVILLSLVVAFIAAAAGSVFAEVHA